MLGFCFVENIILSIDCGIALPFFSMLLLRKEGDSAVEVKLINWASGIYKLVILSSRNKVISHTILIILLRKVLFVSTYHLCSLLDVGKCKHVL